jgi:hypothetical protein
MLIHHLFEASHVTTDSPEFRSWFAGSKVVDANDNPLPVYHGAGRPDRIGNRFRKTRATSGPMAYFTDDPEIASNYAMTKADTSRDGEDYNYQDWFLVKFPNMRSEVSIDRAWYFLSRDEQAKISALAPRVAHDQDDDSQIVLRDERHTGGLGPYEYHLKQARGNALMALVEGWLIGGVLYNDEEAFLQVLRLAGLTRPVRYFPPSSTMPFVYKVYLCIRNPLISIDMPQKVIDALQAVSSKQRRVTPRAYKSQWDKDNVDAREWFRGLLDDVESTGGVNSWTVIPDWVTKTLISLGYDGIRDLGGKNTKDHHHTVWIPFHEYQVKSAISNRGYDPSKLNILQ